MAFWRDIEYFWNTPADGESGFVGSFSNDATRVESSIQVRNWQLLQTAIAEFTGYPVLRRIATGVAWIDRRTPHAHQEFRDLLYNQPWLYCTSVSRVEGRSLDETTAFQDPPTYRMAHLRLVHQSLTYEILENNDPRMQFAVDPAPLPGEPGQDNPLLGTNFPDEATLMRYVTKWPKPFNRMITVPRALAKFVLESGDRPPKKGDDTDASTGPVLFEGVGYPEPGQVLRYTWHLVPREGMPLDQANRTTGKVNRYRFDGYPARTLLCEAPEYIPIRSANGQRLADIHYTFRYLGKFGRNDGLQKTWNHFLRYVDRSDLNHFLDYRLVTMTGTSSGAPVFMTEDFSKLFRPV